jgi:hypothetical protein
LLSRDGDSSFLSYGSTTDQALLPAITDTTLLNASADLLCYDAVWLQLDNTAVVDCSEKTANGIENVFYLVNTQTHSVQTKIKNILSVPEANAHSRKLQVFSDASKRLLVRAYLSDSKGSSETVAEVWSFASPQTPRLLQKIDRDLLAINSLAIQDFQIDQSTIYVLDAANGIFRVAMLGDGSLSVVERAQTSSGFSKLSVYSTALGNRRKIALAGEGRVLEFDWAGQTPQLAYSYTVPGGALISLTLSEEFVVVQVSETAFKDASSVYIFRSRVQNSYLKAHSVFTHP